MSFLHPTVTLLTLAFAGSAVGSTFYTSSGSAASGDLLFQGGQDPLSFEEIDLDALPVGSAIGQLVFPSGHTVDVHLGANLAPSGFPIAVAGPFGGIGQYGTVMNIALRNTPSLGATPPSQPQMQFQLNGASTFGAWIFDDDLATASAFRLVVRDTTGAICTSPVIDAVPNGTGAYAVDGFLGAMSGSNGIDVAAIECGTWNGINPATFVPFAPGGPKFEVDHVQIGFVPTCPCDLNGDGVVDGGDLGLLGIAWGTSPPFCPDADFNADGNIDGAEVGILLASWGPCP